MAGLGCVPAKNCYTRLVDFGDIGTVFTPIMASLQQQAGDLIAKLQGSMDINQYIKYEKKYLHYKTKLLNLVAELESAVSATPDKKSKMTTRLDRVEIYPNKRMSKNSKLLEKP